MWENITLRSNSENYRNEKQNICFRGGVLDGN